MGEGWWPVAEPEPWRCFVAVPISDELRAALRETVAGMRAALPAADESLRWTEPEGWHVSLAFIGPMPQAEVPRLAAALAGVAANHPPFSVRTGLLGAFPSRREVRVLWFGMADRSRRLAELAIEVRAAVGVDLSAPFRAHLTLARARGERPMPLPEAIWRASLPSGQFSVDRLILFRSRLGSGPPRYDELAVVPLQARVTAGGSR